MKTKILFVGYSLKIGGIERALVEQLKSIDFNKFDVDLFLISQNGPYLSEIPSQIRLLKTSHILQCMGLTKNDSRKNLFSFIVRNTLAIIARIIGAPSLLKFILRTIKIEDLYDVAISYVNNGSLKGLYCGCNEIVAYHVKSKRKIAWIHSDYVFGKLHNSYNDSLYQKFDAIVNVSKSMRDKFNALGIVNIEKSFVVYNRYDIRECIKKSNATIPVIDKDLFMIVTIGRLEQAKGTDRLLEVAYELKKRKVRFKWYFLGIGVLFDKVKNKIFEYNLQNDVFLLGQINNPYPFINRADLLVSGSISETFGLTILEALTLKTPVVALEYEALHELLTINNGIICTQYSDMVNSIETLVNNNDQYTKLKSKTELLYDYNLLNKKQFDYLINSVI